MPCHLDLMPMLCEIYSKGSVGEHVLRAVAVAQLDDTAERDRAVELVARRVGSAMTAGPVAARRRLLAALARRGYPADMSVQVVDKAVQAHTAPQG